MLEKFMLAGLIAAVMFGCICGLMEMSLYLNRASPRYGVPGLCIAIFWLAIFVGLVCEK